MELNDFVIGETFWRGALWIADAGNHRLRRADLDARELHTVGGPLRSPWDVAPYSDEILVIAMAGTHQLWGYDPRYDPRFDPRYGGGYGRGYGRGAGGRGGAVRIAGQVDQPDAADHEDGRGQGAEEPGGPQEREAGAVGVIGLGGGTVEGGVHAAELVGLGLGGGAERADDAAGELAEGRELGGAGGTGTEVPRQVVAPGGVELSVVIGAEKLVEHTLAHDVWVAVVLLVSRSSASTSNQAHRTSGGLFALPREWSGGGLGSEFRAAGRPVQGPFRPSSGPDPFPAQSGG